MNSYEALSAYYDRFTEDVGYAGWADFFERVFAREGVQPRLILDLACGTGSLTRLLADRGYEMIGADASPDMLMQAMQNTMDCDPRPLFLNQRMEDLDLYGTVDVCPVSYTHLPPCGHSPQSGPCSPRARVRQARGTRPRPIPPAGDSAPLPHRTGCRARQSWGL